MSFAILDASTIWILIPVTALIIPIVAILTQHQQRMASLMHGGSGVALEEVQALRTEVAELRRRMDVLELGAGSPKRELPGQ